MQELHDEASCLQPCILGCHMDLQHACSLHITLTAALPTTALFDSAGFDSEQRLQRNRTHPTEHQGFLSKRQHEAKNGQPPPQAFGTRPALGQCSGSSTHCSSTGPVAQSPAAAETAS